MRFPSFFPAFASSLAACSSSVRTGQLWRALLVMAALGFSSLAAQAQVTTPATTPAVAPEAEAAIRESAECGPVQPVELCVDFDARRSFDSGADSLEYRWHMGDGTTLTGLTISHCYKERSRYQVVLDVRVVATGEVRPAERTFVVDLLKKPVLDFRVAPATAIHVNQPVTFEDLESVLPTCQSLIVTWDFRDGFTQQGQRVEHTFRKPGRFQVRMSLRGYGPGSCTFSNCVSQEVVVAP